MTLRGSVRALPGGDAVYSLADQVLVSGLNFAVGIIAARLLGVADFGLFGLALMLSALLSQVQHNFLLAPMMTLAGARRRTRPVFFDAIAKLGLVLSAVSAVLMIAILTLFFMARGEAPRTDVVMAAALLTFAQNQMLVLRRVLFARGASQRAFALDVLRVLAMLGLVALASAIGLTVDVAGALIVLAASACLALLPFSGHLATAPRRQRYYRAVLARQWPMARWLVLLVLVAVGQDHAIWVIAGVELGDAALGGLRAAQYLLGVTHFVVLAMENFVPRGAARAWRDGGHAAVSRYLLRQMALLGAPIAALMVAVAAYPADILAVVFGDGFAAYGALTQVFVAIYAVNFARRILSYYLRAIERTRSLFGAFAAGSLAALGVIWPAIDGFGLEGAAFAMLAGEVVCLLFVAGAVMHSWRSVRGGPDHAGQTRFTVAGA